MESILICCDKSPYGTNITAEALRLASGFIGLGPGMECEIVFDEDAVIFLKKNLDVKALQVDSLEEPLELLDLVEAKVYVMEEALRARGLTRDDLLDELEIEVISVNDLSKLILKHSATFHM